MRPYTMVVRILALVAIVAAPASAHEALHVNDAYSSCFFDLHPELTKAQFGEFTDELGSVMRFRQLGETTTLGKGNFDIGVQYAQTPIDDRKAAWNNTMSHPDADHVLGSPLEFPRLVVRYGVSDGVDLGVWGTVAPGANYGLVGFDTKVLLMRQGPDRPVSVAIRPSLSSLVGPAELWAGNASIDLSASREFGPVSPYLGVATSASVAIERSNDVDLDPAFADDGVVYAGVSWRWRALRLSAEAEQGVLSSYGIRIGTAF